MARLRRSLSVWQAIGLSVALMAPSMAANINPQLMVPSVGRAVPLAFLMAAIAVLLVAYGFVRLCQYFNHAGSVYAFVGATLGPRTGVVAGLGLLGTYTCYAVGTASATGIFGTKFLEMIGVWPHPPNWAAFALAAVGLAIALLFTVAPARRGTGLLLVAEAATVALILLVTVIVLVRLGSDGQFTVDVFTVPAETDSSALFLGVVFGFLSFAGFEAAATLGEETAEPRRNIPRAILGTAIFGGGYFVVVTAVEMMAFGDPSAFAASSALVGDLGASYVGAWVGDVITLGAAVSAFACMLACVVGGSRLLFALGRDAGVRSLGTVSSAGTPARAAVVVALAVFVIMGGCAVFFGATVPDTFGWFSTIGTLILLVAYLLTTLGAIRLVFVQRLMDVPRWQIVIPLAAVVVLGYTLYRNVIPYPPEGPAQWFPVVAGGWLVLALLVVLLAPGTARRVGEKLADVR